MVLQIGLGLGLQLAGSTVGSFVALTVGFVLVQGLLSQKYAVTYLKIILF